MLNGIGGRTVEEAKANLSNVEFLDWVAYANQKGTLNLGIRLEWGVAMICMLLSKGFKIKREGGGDFKLQDFMPHIRKDDDEESELTFEMAAQALGVKF